MDLAIADVTDLPEDAVKPGTHAELFDAEVAIDDFAACGGTIGYQVLMSLAGRYGRDYVEVLKGDFKFARILNWRNSWA